MTTIPFPMPAHIGDSHTYEAHGHTYRVRRISATTWTLRNVEQDRVRFGTMPEIREDVAHTIKNGCLPPVPGKSWA